MAKKPGEQEEKESDRDEFLDAVGERIKSARLRVKLTQKELANLLSTNQSWIYMAEDGQQNLQLGSLRKIAQVLNVSVRDLIPDDLVSISDIVVPPEVNRTIQRLIAQLAELVLIVAAEKHKESAPSNGEPPKPTKATR